MGNGLLHPISTKGLKYPLDILTGSCGQVSGPLFKKYIFGGVCLQHSCLLDKGRNIPEFLEL
jgi:hypothetical protein